MIFKDLIKGIQKLHDIGVAHRDIKLDNIMLECSSNQVKPKYIDFGLSKILLHGQEDEDRFGTLAYCSPEILLGNKHTHMTDIWSLGIILHVILSSCFPYLSNDKNQTKKNIIAGKLNFSRSAWDRVSRSAKDLIVRILQPDPSKRFSI